LAINMGVQEGDARTPALLRDMFEEGFTPRDDTVKSVKARFEDLPAQEALTEMVDEAEEPTVHEPLTDLRKENIAKPRVQDAMPSIEQTLTEPMQDSSWGVGKTVPKTSSQSTISSDEKTLEKSAQDALLAAEVQDAPTETIEAYEESIVSAQVSDDTPAQKHNR